MLNIAGLKIYSRSRPFNKLVNGAAFLSAAIVLSSSPALAQAPQQSLLPTMIGENGLLGAQQGVSTGLSFLLYTPTAQATATNPAQKTPVTYGVSDSLNLLDPLRSGSSSLSLTGAALFADPTTGGKQQSQKQAIYQTLGYSHGAVSFSLGFIDIGK